MEADKVVLGYWNYRGRGQYLRHLLTHSNIPFEERIYANPGEWFTKDGDKTKLLGPMPFPNLPYLKHGDKYITETTAIAKYIAILAKKPELVGITPQEQTTIETLWSLLEDLWSPTVSLFFTPSFAASGEMLYRSKINDKLAQINQFIGSERPFLTGTLTIADFKLAQLFQYMKKLYSSKTICEFKNILRVKKSVAELKGVLEYYTREKAVKGPFLSEQTKLKFDSYQPDAV